MRRWVPEVRLSDADFVTRHRVLRAILCLHLPLIIAVAVLGGHAGLHLGGTGHRMAASDTGGAWMIWTMIGGVLLCAILAGRLGTRRTRSLSVSVGLLLAASALVHAGGGLTDLHFHYFVVLALISLYQNWLPFVVAVLLVAVHHLVIALIAPTLVYSDPQAQAHPLNFALLHAAFVLAMCAAQVAYWKFAETARTAAEAVVRSREERFRALVQDSCDVVSVVDRDGRALYVSPAIHQITGFPAEDFVGIGYGEWVHPDDLADADRLTAQALADPGGQHRVELRTRHADGGLRWLEVTLRNLLDNPAVAGLVATCRDVTERRAIHERLAYDANHDPLTGLSNRAAFLRGLEQIWADGLNGAGPPAVLFLDLDGFKQVNDNLGHHCGDTLIVAVAAMLRRSVLGSDIVGRLGGDEFGIVLPGIDSPDNAITVAKRVLAEMDRPVLVSGQEVYARASVGVAIAGPGCASADELLQHADIAMYNAKRRKTHSFQVYADGLPALVFDEEVLDEELRRAVGNGELRLQYQPIVALDGGDLIAVEALVRWEHPTRGLLGPLEFIPRAERTGVIGELGAWVLEHACRQVRQWQQRVPAGRRLGLSVNLSPYQLEQHDLVDDVMAILRRTGYDPADLVLEVTESALVNDEAAIPQLTALNAHGIRIALDDFGTGYSSLRYLTRLPVDILKIDRCFVAELNGTGSASAVAEAVVRLAQILHLETVAEGIEDIRQANELTLLGCKSGQGYHFARPLDAEAVGALIAGTPAGWPSLAGTPNGLAAAGENRGATAVPVEVGFSSAEYAQ
jgi:diguanylate cyclase (GGDEF)-like protein/PAS domain S-box-containing protein